MRTRLICLISLVSVLGLSAGAKSATEVAHWRLDNDARDSVGGIHGTLMNGAGFTTDAMVGSHALQLDGVDDYVDFGNPSTLPSGSAERSLCGWGKTDSVAAGWAWIASYGTGGASAGNAMCIGRNGTTLYGSGMYSDIPVLNFWSPGAWHHICLTYGGGTAKLYADGVEMVSVATTWNLVLNNCYIGRQCYHTGENWDGVIDDVHIYKRVLTPSQIKDLYNGIPPDFKKAWNPSPPDGAPAVTSPLFGWKAGDDAAYHNIYFGTNPTPGAAEFIVQQPLNYAMYWHLPGLVSGTTYYWRIDEVEADGVTIHTGDVWSCTAAPLAAYSPNPPDGAKYVFTDAVLSWLAGTKAFKHDVYFGTNETDVANGTGGTFKVSQPITTYTPGTLAKDTTYYWRVDEVESNGITKYKGDVWRFKTIPDITISDPNLIAWWKLDEGQGTVVLDWSGHGHQGTLLNGPQWVAGYDGGALDFDGSDDYVDFGNPTDFPSGTSARSMCGWGKTDSVAGGWRWIAAYGSPATSQAMFIGMTGTDLYGGGYGDDVLTAGYWQVGEWHHICLTYDGATARLYADGVQVDSAAKTWGLVLSRVHIGRQVNTAAEFWNGLVDDVRIYNKALTPAEIKQAMRGDPTLAWNPKPSRGAIVDIEHATPLSWSPGEKAGKHDVYFGTDADAVSDADASDTTGVYRGRQDPNTYTPPAAIEGGQTYYWRIDEYNTDATITEGRIWDFTVTDYLIVDDFEAYDDWCNRVFYAWTDGWGYSADPTCGVAAYGGNGTGSTVGNLNAPFSEQTVVHGGGQSMPFAYDNSGTTPGKARYSETQRQWASPQDFTRQAVRALTLYFYGDPANAAEQLYVALEDNAGQVKVAKHPELEAVQVRGWQEWNIELTQFAGVNLKAVKKMYIGLGSRVSPAAGGSGKIYIDDIRLYRPRCVPSLAKPDADLSGNCIVDYADVEIVSDQWLNSGFVVTPVNPGSTGLIAHYPFEGNANDVVGGHNGTISGVVTYGPGKIGQAIVLDGVGSLVTVGPVGISGVAARTIAGWVRAHATVGSLPNWINIFGFTGPSGANGHFDIEIGAAQGRRGYVVHVYGWERVIMDVDFEWHNLAASYDGTTIAWYGDGRLVGTDSTRVLNTPDNVHMGKRQDNDNYFPGRVDEVRIYNRTLSEAQIAWLAGYASPISIPADLHQDNKIDFKDFAVLADSWLEELLWPQP
jgi:hypothetical protein